MDWYIISHIEKIDKVSILVSILLHVSSINIVQSIFSHVLIFANAKFFLSQNLNNVLAYQND